jgi:hypothetical protein
MKECYVRNILVPLIITLIGVGYFIRSGVIPDFTTLNIEVGYALLGGGLFLFIDRLLSGNPNKALEKEIRQLRESVDVLREDVNDWQ